MQREAITLTKWGYRPCPSVCTYVLFCYERKESGKEKSKIKGAMNFTLRGGKLSRNAGIQHIPLLYLLFYTLSFSLRFRLHLLSREIFFNVLRTNPHKTHIHTLTHRLHTIAAAALSLAFPFLKFSLHSAAKQLLRQFLNLETVRLKRIVFA